ncbi:hypothetical protein BC751_0757 [Cecembia calidifontis]|uniref:Uncharacterized protein n=1 Tax=Cecembia calidifontis TaxID=1187080 RepID=A0A4Q7P6T9_9BACT|nr:hypothetical protein BC751_0757 [Cecembia calidifontis]
MNGDTIELKIPQDVAASCSAYILSLSLNPSEINNYLKSAGRI